MLPLNRKARVVHVLRTMDMGGTTKTAQLFVNYLAKACKDQYDLSVLYNATGDLTRFQFFAESVSLANMIPYMHEPAGTQILASLKPDLVHVYRNGLPEWPRKPEQSLFVETNVFGNFDYANPPDKSLFMSKWLMNQAKRMYGDRESFDYINNPIDPPASEEKLDIAADLAANLMPPETVILGRCGRPDDGIYDPISLLAISLLQTSFPLHFIAVAPPPTMIKHLKQYGISHTILPPTVDEVTLSKFYNTIDIYCHSRADGETFGNNIAEAMAHKKPVITHVAVPQHPGMGVFQAQIELVENNKTGVVVNHSVNEYVAAIHSLVVNKQLRIVMGAAGFAKWRLEIISGVAGLKLNSIYSDLLYHNSHLLRK